VKGNETETYKVANPFKINKTMSEDTQIASKGQEVEKKDPEELKPNTEEVKTEEVKETTEAPKVDEVDYEVLIKEQSDKIAKLETDKDNYRKMALKYKKDSKEEPEDVEPELSGDERIRAIVKEEFYNSEIAEAQRKKDELLTKLVRENKELKVANKNSVKSNISSGGGGAEEREVPDNSISPEKLNELYAFADAAGLDRESFMKRYKQTK
jgi:hypothetical protein